MSGKEGSDFKRLEMLAAAAGGYAVDYVENEETPKEDPRVVWQRRLDESLNRYHYEKDPSSSSSSSTSRLGAEADVFLRGPYGPGEPYRK